MHNFSERSYIDDYALKWTIYTSANPHFIIIYEDTSVKFKMSSQPFRMKDYISPPNDLLTDMCAFSWLLRSGQYSPQPPRPYAHDSYMSNWDSSRDPRDIIHIQERQREPRNAGRDEIAALAVADIYHVGFVWICVLL